MVVLSGLHRERQASVCLGSGFERADGAMPFFLPSGVLPGRSHYSSSPMPLQQVAPSGSSSAGCGNEVQSRLRRGYEIQHRGRRDELQLRCCFRFRSRRPVTSPAASSFRHPRLGPQSSLLRLSHQRASFPPPLLTAAGRRQPSAVATNSRSAPNHRLQQQIRSRTPPVSICKKDQQVLLQVSRMSFGKMLSQILWWRPVIREAPWLMGPASRRALTEASVFEADESGAETACLEGNEFFRFG